MVKLIITIILLKIIIVIADHDCCHLRKIIRIIAPQINECQPLHMVYFTSPSFLIYYITI